MIRRSVAEILDHHVTFELEAIDRMYLDAYVPSLQTGGGFAYLLWITRSTAMPNHSLDAQYKQAKVKPYHRAS